MNMLLAGLTVLVIGDSHMAKPDYLLTPLHDALTRRGAVVHAHGACGLPAADWLHKKRSTCGSAVQAAAAPARAFSGKEGSTTPYAELQQSLKPDLVVVVIADAMGDYMKSDIPKAWLWQQVTALTKAIKESRTPCVWVGPPWGEGGRFGKSTERVKAYSEYLSDIVAPCAYVDSTTFFKPADWPTIDGLHLTGAGYAAWAESIAEAVAARRPK